MSSSIKQFFVYTKVTILVAALLTVLLFVFLNRNYESRFWPGATDAPVPTLWLMLVTACVSVVTFWLLCRVRRVWREVVQAAAERKQTAARKELEDKQRALSEQEQRIDEKLKKALTDGDSQP